MGVQNVIKYINALAISAKILCTCQEKRLGQKALPRLHIWSEFYYLLPKFLLVKLASSKILELRNFQEDITHAKFPENTPPPPPPYRKMVNSLCCLLI